MKRTFTFMVAAALMGILAFSGGALAAKPPNAGNGGGSGGSSGGETPDLGDLIVLYRDEYGRPIPTEATTAVDDEGAIVPAGLCQQPLAAPGETLPAVGDILSCVPASETESCIIPVVPLTCGVVAGYEAYTQEVDFGRTSVIRSPVSVIEQSLAEAVTKLATAQCTSLDPAGRLVNTSKIDDVDLSATIDSPLENLAIYRQLMLTGDLGPSIILPDSENPMNVLNTAARGLGAAADKTGKVTVDQVVYSNQIMGLLDVPTYLPKLCVIVREEVQGNMVEVDKCVLDYTDYDYSRADNFAALPAPPYIDEYAIDGTIIQEDVPGWFEYLGVYDEGPPPLFEIVHGPIMDNVFGTDADFEAGNVGGFTQAADDAREVIDFMHSNPLPLGYETAVPMCGEPNTGLIYDVSISEESGLQVPKNIVDGSSDREFIVTVANAGPSDATVTLRVTAIPDVEGTVEADLVGDDAGFIPSPFDFEPIVIPAGENRVFSGFISVDIGQRATIDWEATATAIPYCADCDLNDNSTRTAVSNVKVTGGGGGGRGR